MSATMNPEQIKRTFSILDRAEGQYTLLFYRELAKNNDARKHLSAITMLHYDEVLHASIQMW